MIILVLQIIQIFKVFHPIHLFLPLRLLIFTKLSTQYNYSIPYIYYTLTIPSSNHHKSLLKTTPLPPGYPWVAGGWYVTPKPRFSGLVLDHQGLEELELKNNPKTAVFDQIWLFLSVFWFCFF